MAGAATGAAAGAAAGSVVPGVGTAVGALGGALLGGIGSIFNNERNLSAQREAQAYNKWAQEKTWEREDNAIQRRTKDLLAAGLHPTLAAGNAAQAGSPTKIDPVMSQDALGTEGAISGLARAAQTQQSLMAVEAAKAQINLTKAQETKVNTQAAVLSKEFGLYGEPGGHPKYQDTWGKRVSEAIRYIKGSFSTPKLKGTELEKAKKVQRLTNPVGSYVQDLFQ